jgi:hypothetical protein
MEVLPFLVVLQVVVVLQYYLLENIEGPVGGGGPMSRHANLFITFSATQYYRRYLFNHYFIVIIVILKDFIFYNLKDRSNASS